ncbi:Smr/MutS family protein [Kordiimonas sp.]|uniref:Smr/MutS family protein n=1 Tax=Kordiimonas sp. TaxID=1970157 RepID=UPI003A94E5E7
MARKKEPLSARDLEIWRKVTETVTPLGGRPDTPPPPARSRPLIRQEAEGLPYEWHTRTSPKPEARIDRRMQRQIATGRQEVDRSVDLHGMTQDRAFATLRRTIEGAIRRGDKTLLVVTGKGGKRFAQTDATPAAYRTRNDFDQHGGVLRRMVPLWLEGPELKPFIQSYGSAAQEHGGDGALYVILRKRLPGSRRAQA